MTKGTKEKCSHECEWLFGLHAVQSVLKTSGSKIQELKVQKGRDDQRLRKIINLAELQNIPVTCSAVRFRRSIKRPSSGRSGSL